MRIIAQKKTIQYQIDEELQRQRIKTPTNIRQSDAPTMIEDDVPPTQPSYEPRHSQRIALTTYHQANSAICVNRDAVYQLLTQATEQPKEWAPCNI